MILEREIYKKTNVQIQSIPRDGKSRAFKVGHREWFAIQFDNSGAFGCLSQNLIFGWDGGLAYQVHCVTPEKMLKKSEIEQERKIIVIGNSLTDSGHPLAGADLDRYILALTRSINYDAQIAARNCRDAQAAR